MGIGMEIGPRIPDISVSDAVELAKLVARRLIAHVSSRTPQPNQYVSLAGYANSIVESCNKINENDGKQRKNFRSIYKYVTDILVADLDIIDNVGMSYAGGRLSARLGLQAIQRALSVYGDIELDSAAQELQDIVPPQKIAPIKFEIMDGVLSIRYEVDGVPDEDKGNVDFAHQMLVESVSALKEELNNSNCDRRLLNSVQNIKSALDNRENVIKLGMLNDEVRMMSAAFSEEISPAIVSMLSSMSINIQTYLAQFPDWVRFSQNALSVKLSETDIERIAGMSRDIRSRISQTAEFVDEEVPKTIQFFENLIAEPGAASRRAGYAMFRSLENMVSKIFEYGAKFIDDIVRKTSDSVSSVVGKGAALMLLSLALPTALGLSSLTSKISDTQWLKIASEIVDKALSKGAD